MRTTRILAALGLASAPLLMAAPAQADTVNFTLAEQNRSGAQAQATVTTNANGSMTVDIQGSGFTPNAPHAQHLHGAPEGGFFCPTAAADKNGDGQVATEEGVAQYGGVMVSLTTKGDASADSGLAVDRMPVADASGNLSYSRTIPAADIPDGVVENLASLHIVQHGLDVNGNDKYDMKALGESKFAKSLGVDGIPEEATNPATCGEVSPAGGVETGGAGTDGTESMPLLALGGAALAGSAGIVVMRRRTVESQVRG
jgi:LPXTG-motif cell wall-anchored protein